uniref:Uncharacterized protein n=1 Tax=Salix viminalis TaxID=40686 RepID=A0A6N2MZM1_SALVM
MTLNHCRKAGKGAVRCCTQLLYIWMESNGSPIALAVIAFDSRRFGVKESTIAILGANRSMLYLSFCLRVTRFFSLNPVKFLRFPPLFGLSYGHSRLNKSKSVISPGILRELRRHRAYSSKKVFSSPLLLSNLKTERTSSLYFSIV